MAEPEVYNWCSSTSTDTDYIRTALSPMSGALESNGYAYGEIPANQDHNTLFRNKYLWEQYLLSRQKSNEATLLRSSGSATWNGSQLVLSANLDMSFRKSTGEQINRIAAGTLTFADGDVLVLRKDLTSSSPVTVVSGTYSNLNDGEYAIVAENTLADDNEEYEKVIFRRKGTDLECPGCGFIYPTGSVITFGSSVLNTSAYLVPIGTIIPFYDYNGSLTFDTSIWKYCDGSSVTVGSLGAQTLPDLSNRYLVGFGTEGGGDIDTAVWGTSAVGNASHEVNLQHSHTVNAHTHTTPNHAHTLSAHTHTGPSHTHTGPSHTHGIPGLGYDAGSNRLGMVEGSMSLGSSIGTVDGYWTATMSNDTTYLEIQTDSSGTGSTGSSGTGATGAPSTDSTNTSGSGTSGSASPGTDSQLTTTQSIQPRSIRVRFLMRVA